MTGEPSTRERTYEEPGPDQAAAVVTDDGAWGRVPPPYRPAEPRTGAGPAWWIGAIFVIVGALWLGAFSLSQLSSRSVAIPAIERGVASLTEIDQLLSLHEEDLCRLAATDAPIEVPGYPIRGINVQLSDIHCTDGELDRDALRALLLSQSAEQVYLHGAGAFLEDSGALDDPSILSASGGIRTILNSIGAGTHDRATTAAWVLGGASAVLFLATMLLGRGVRRFAGLGLALMLAALPMLLGTLILWAVLGAMDGGTGLTAQFAQITRSLLNLPIRNAFGLTAAGVALIVPALLVARAVQRARAADWWEYGRQ